VYLGKWKSEEAATAYAKVIADFARPRPVPAPDGKLSVAELIAAFKGHVERYYRRPDGTPTFEVDGFRQSLRPVREIFGSKAAEDFGPLDLEAVRERMIAAGWCRTLVNRRINRVKRMFKWAVAKELVPAQVLVGLQALEGLKAGRSQARETEPVEPVDEGVVRATLPHLTRQVAGLVRFQLHTGCRPGEACMLRRCDLDTSGPVWLYQPAWHKLAYRNKPRTIAVGPQAQAVLREFPTFDPNDFIFNPAKAVHEFHDGRTAARKTPRYPSHVERNESKRVRVGKRPPGRRYTTASYGAAVRKAVAEAGVEPWHPNQLRHLFGTIVRRNYGLEAAQVTLGHARADVTQIYAERDRSLAIKVAAAVG
jgi:integrase